jgi:ABC-type antimicrobial peptide transport system permease subunit
VEFEVVGLLEPGILQGAVVASEEDFLAIHPGSSGSRLLLADVPSDGPSVEAATMGLQRALTDYGATVRTASARLAALGAVQNTYLAGFQALGALGLVLGTAGVAAVQVRALLERSREFGLLSAIGFTGPRLTGLVATETVAMVAAGLMIGIIAALIAVWPQLCDGRASPPLLWAAATSAVTLLSAWMVGRLVVGRLAAFSPIEAMRAAE